MIVIKAVIPLEVGGGGAEGWIYRSPDGFGNFTQAVVTLTGYILFLGVWPADLPLIIPANVTAGNVTDSLNEPGVPDHWLIIYSVSFGICCLYLITNVPAPVNISFIPFSALSALSKTRLRHRLCKQRTFPNFHISITTLRDKAVKGRHRAQGSA